MIANGVLFAARTPKPLRSGYEEDPFMIETPDVEVFSVAVIPLAADIPVLTKVIVRLPPSPGSITPFPLPP